MSNEPSYKRPNIDMERYRDFKVKISQIPPMDLAFQNMAINEYELLVATIYRLNDLIEVHNNYTEKIDEILKWVLNEGIGLAVLEHLNVWLNDGTLENLINETLLNMKLDKSEFEEYKLVVNQTLQDLEQSIQSIIDDETIRIDGEISRIDGEISRIDGEIVDLDNKQQQITTQLAEKANYNDVRFKGVSISLNDVDSEFLTAIKGGEGTSFNLLSIPREKSVTPETTTFVLNDPQNLFNPEMSTDGIRLGQDGSIVDSLGWFTSDFIPVVNGKTYKIFANGTVTGRVIGYATDKTFLKLLNNGYNTKDGLDIPIDFNGFLRVAFQNSVSKNNVQIVDSEIYNGKFSPFKYVISDKIFLNVSSLPEKSISTDLLADKSVKPEKTTFFILSKNLFDKTKSTQGYFVSASTGNLSENDNYSTSDYIPVKPSTMYARNYINQIAFYNANKTFISGLSTVEQTTVFTTPSNCAFVRVTISNIDTYQLEEGTEVTSYENFGHKFSSEYIPQNVSLKTPAEIIGEFLYSDKPFKVKLLGDSITHGSGGTGRKDDGDLIPGTEQRMNPNGYCWANSLRDLLQTKYNVQVVNYALPGKNSQHIHDLRETLIEEDDDLVIIQLGTNDRHNLTSTNLTKQYQRGIIETAYTKGAKVILMSACPTTVEADNDPSRYFGMFDVDKAIHELANEYGMKHISNYDAYLQFSEFRDINMDTLLADGLHPNDMGYDVMFRNIVRNLGMSYVRPGITK